MKNNQQPKFKSILFRTAGSTGPERLLFCCTMNTGASYGAGWWASGRRVDHHSQAPQNRTLEGGCGEGGGEEKETKKVIKINKAK